MLQFEAERARGEHDLVPDPGRSPASAFEQSDLWSLSLLVGEGWAYFQCLHSWERLIRGNAPPPPPQPHLQLDSHPQPFPPAYHQSAPQDPYQPNPQYLPPPTTLHAQWNFAWAAGGLSPSPAPWC